MKKQIVTVGFNDFEVLAPLKAELAPTIAEHLERINAANAVIIDAKNGKDNADTVAKTVWNDVFSVVKRVKDATEDKPEYRHLLFTALMGDLLVQRTDEAGNKLKATTGQQYASLGRKVLVELITNRNSDVAKLEAMSVKDVRKEFKSVTLLAEMERFSEISKQVRYVIKNGTEAEKAGLEAVYASITGLYAPVKARKDKASKKGQAAVAVPELQQQAPAEGGAVETVQAEEEAIHEAAEQLGVEGDDKEQAAVGGE